MRLMWRCDYCARAWYALGLVGTHFCVQCARLMTCFEVDVWASGMRGIAATTNFGLSPFLHAAELQCILANLIYRKYIKGYLAYKPRVLVLAKADAFPDLASVQLGDPFTL